MVVHSDYLDGASGLAHLPWHWQWCVTESREILKEKQKKETDICGSLLLEVEDKKGNGRWRGRGKGIEMAYLWSCGLCEDSGMSFVGTGQLLVPQGSWEAWPEPPV